MAKLIYKDGCEGLSSLSYIDGIEIELRKGQKALIYPKYAEREIVKEEQIGKWSARVLTQLGALKVDDTNDQTEALLKIGSPAAEWVSQFCSDNHGLFYLPSLWAAMEIQNPRNDIDAIAETIEGADLLKDFTSCVVSYCRHSQYNCWCAYGHELLAGGSAFCSHLVVPTILH